MKAVFQKEPDTLAPQQLSFVFGGMSYTQSKRPSLIAADAVLCLPCETAEAAAVLHTVQNSLID